MQIEARVKSWRIVKCTQYGHRCKTERYIASCNRCGWIDRYCHIRALAAVESLRHQDQCIFKQ